MHTFIEKNGIADALANETMKSQTRTIKCLINLDKAEVPNIVKSRQAK